MSAKPTLKNYFVGYKPLITDLLGMEGSALHMHRSCPNCANQILWVPFERQGGKEKEMV